MRRVRYSGVEGRQTGRLIAGGGKVISHGLGVGLAVIHVHIMIPAPQIKLLYNHPLPFGSASSTVVLGRAVGAQLIEKLMWQREEEELVERQEQEPKSRS